MSFGKYLLGTIISPYDTFNRLRDDPKQLVHGSKAILLIGVLYTLTVIGLAVVKAEITVPAWISIPEDRYYFWEIFFALPVFILGWIMAAGVAHLLSRFFRGRGTFESTLAVLAFAVTIPSFVSWITETIGTILIIAGVMTHADWVTMTSGHGFWQAFGLAYQLAALAWCFFLFPVAISRSQSLRAWQASIVGVSTFLVFGFFMFVFIR